MVKHVTAAHVEPSPFTQFRGGGRCGAALTDDGFSAHYESRVTNLEHKKNWRARRHDGAGAARWLVVILLSWLTLAQGRAQQLKDNFAERQVATSPTGQVRQSNAGAGVESGEPLHGGKPGGHSMWISWVAPSNGVVRFETEHTAFDTLLAAYYFPTTNDSAIEQLVMAASADDSEGFEHESEIKFGVLAGQRYEIAVDGYRGAIGSITLEWDFYPSVRPPPIILSSPTDRAVTFGETIALAVVLTNEANGRYRWYHDNDLLDADSPTLVITNFQAADVGRYKLRVILDGPDYYSTAAEMQINTEGALNTLAQDKVLDSVGSGLTPAGMLRAAVTGGVLRGYNGSQLFSTLYALAEPDEPDHCRVTSGGSYWFSYQPPADGTAILDTIGSRFDTVIAVYTYRPPLMSYEQLIPVACDNDSIALRGAARVEFAVVKDRQYAVVVAGVNSAKGAARLNYRLDVTRPPVPPTLVQPAAPRIAAAGEALTLQPQIIGSAPLFFTWRKDGNLIPGATNASLRLNPAAPAHTGRYLVTVSNLVGAPLEVSTPVRVLVVPRLSAQRSNDVLTVSLPTVTGQSYQLEQCSTPTGPWTALTEVIAGDGSVLSLTNTLPGDVFFFRVRVD